MPIERAVGGARAPIGHVIRQANHKTFLEIHQEIRSVQTGPVPPNKGVPVWVRFIRLLSWPLPRVSIALLRAARRRDPAGPAGIVPTGGTVAVIAAGVFGKHSGWG